MDKHIILESINDEVLKLKLESARVFNQLLIELYPKRYWEDLDYEDYKVDIANSLDSYVTKLNTYQKKYSIVFDNKLIKEIKTAEGIADKGKFQFDSTNHPTNEGLKAAETFIKKMEQINTLIKANITLYTN